MRGLKIIALLFVICTSKLYAQKSVSELKRLRKEALGYKEIYIYSDSINKAKGLGFLESNVFTTTRSLDKLEPTSYFMKAIELMGKHKYNEASFIYYLGLLRFRYYNSADPNYKSSAGGALLASLEYEVGEPTNMYLKADADNL